MQIQRLLTTFVNRALGLVCIQLALERARLLRRHDWLELHVLLWGAHHLARLYCLVVACFAGAVM